MPKASTSVLRLPPDDAIVELLDWWAICQSVMTKEPGRAESEGFFLLAQALRGHAELASRGPAAVRRDILHIAQSRGRTVPAAGETALDADDGATLFDYAWGCVKKPLGADPWGKVSGIVGSRCARGAGTCGQRRLLLAAAVRQAQLGGQAIVFSCDVIARAFGWIKRTVALWRKEYDQSGVFFCVRESVPPTVGRGRAAEYLVVADESLVTDAVEVLHGFMSEDDVRQSLRAARDAARRLASDSERGRDDC